MVRRLFLATVIIYMAIFGWFMQIRQDRDAARLRISQDFIFPLRTTKAAIAHGSVYGGQTLAWVPESPESYHHDYVAADIHVAEGTIVQAAKGGRVVAVRDVKTCTRKSFPYVLIHAVDNYYYLYSHLKPGSIQVGVEDAVEAGQEIAQVGSSQCAQATAPHLHLDVSRFRSAVRGGFWGQVTLIDPQPALNKSYLLLP